MVKRWRGPLCYHYKKEEGPGGNASHYHERRRRRKREKKKKKKPQSFPGHWRLWEVEEEEEEEKATSECKVVVSPWHCRRYLKSSCHSCVS